MTDDGSSRDGKVGYKRPPVHTRFQKGRSGNPRGRQKGVRNFAADVKRSLEIPVTLNDQGRAKRVSTRRRSSCGCARKRSRATIAPSRRYSAWREPTTMTKQASALAASAWPLRIRRSLRPSPRRSVRALPQPSN